jgi:non-specific protein-tyrosine kinase
VAAVAAGAISRQMTPVYEANATVLVKPAQPLNVDTGQANTGVTSTSDQVAATYAQLMTQPALLSQVSSELHLGWSPETLGSKVKVSPQTNTTVLKVTVTDTDPQRTSTIANKLVRDFSDSQSQLAQQRLGPQTQKAQDQVKQLQGNVAADQAQINRLINQQPSASGPLSQQDQAKLNALQQQVTTDNTQLQNAQAGLAQLQSQAALVSDSVIVVSPASTPTSPVSPKLLLNVLLAAVGGLLLAIGIVLLINRLDQTVKNDDDLQRRTGLTPLGHIPFASAARTRMGELVVLGGSSAASEAYRSLRTNLQFASVDRRLRTIVVTSPAPGEGKSRTAANLAIVLAAAGHTTLLTDADFRRPSIHGFFGKASKRGLSELILNEWNESEPLIRQVPEVPGLWVLAAGTSPPNPSEVLGSARVQALLGELATKFDYVVLDTPPLNAVTDPALLAAHADATLLVIEQGRTTFGSLIHAKNQLDNVGAHLPGVVINKLRATGGKYGYRAYRYYGSSQQVPGNGAKVPAGDEVVPPSQIR